MSSVLPASLGLPRPTHMCWPSCTDMDRRRSRHFTASAGTSAQLTSNLDRLERRKLIRREPNPDDGRSFVILSSPQERAASRVTDALDEVERSVRRALDSNELRSLQTVTEAVGAAIRDHAASSHVAL